MVGLEVFDTQFGFTWTLGPGSTPLIGRPRNFAGWIVCESCREASKSVGIDLADGSRLPAALSIRIGMLQIAVIAHPTGEVTGCGYTFNANTSAAAQRMDTPDSQFRRQ
jgi:hypothetical protein